MTEITGRAMGMVAACPDLAALELAPLAPEIYAHVEVCDTCQLVFELLEVGDAIDTFATCERFEPLIAARADGAISSAAENLLARHLASCSECRELAETLAPNGDRDTDLAALPQVAPAHYALGIEVGRGGMGRVVAARDLRVGRPVAVKELLGRSRQLAARFEREARITARLQHPGIVPIYEIGRWPDGTPFYSMRMVGGGTLREQIAAARTLAERLALLPALIAATEAVAFAHSQRIIHRDLTPSNVLVGAYGETVVIDWGLAKDLSTSRDDEPDAAPGNDPALTNAGAVVGTAAYMPVEQANAEVVDERADVYALGAILYHVLAGTPPYRADAGIAAVKAGAPKRIEVVAPAAPRDLTSIVSKAMSRDPQRRYPSARELAEELKRYQAGRMVEAHEYTTRERMRRFIVRNRAPLVVTAVATLLFGLLGVIAVRRVLRESASAKRTLLASLEEEGRTELLAGDSQRALAYFNAAPSRADDSLALRFMRASAARELLSFEDDLECGGVVRDVSFSPDQKLLVASCHDVARAWRLVDDPHGLTHIDVATFGPNPKGFDHVEFSHDGTRLVTYGGDGVARMWDMKTHAPLQTFTHEAGTQITFATFTPDDTHLATTGYDGYARIWDVATGAQLRSIRGSDSLLLHALYGVLDTKGQRLLTFTIEGIGASWDVASGRKIGSVLHGGFALGGAVAPSGDVAATCGLNHLVKLWDTTQPRLIQQLAGATDAVIACKFNGDGTRVLGTTRDGHAYVWDVASGATVSSVTHGDTLVWTGHFSHDGRRFLTVGVTGTVKVWDTESGGLLSTHETQGGHEANFSPDDKFLIAGRGDGRIRIWRDPAGPQLANYPNEHVIAHSDDGTRLVEESGFGELALRDSHSGAVVKSTAFGTPLAFRDRWLAATTLTGHVVVIDSLTGQTRSELATRRPSDIAVSGTARVVLGFERGQLELWDETGMHPLGDRRHALFDASGTRVLAYGGGTPQVWDARTGTLLRELLSTEPYFPIGFAGDSVVIGEGNDGAYVVAIWNREGERTPLVEAVAARPTLDPKGRFLTVILEDHTIKTIDLVGKRPDTAFVGELLQGAQADPTGTLLTGVAQLGTSVVVLGADDGRLLARWPIAHAPAALSENGGMVAPAGTAVWSSDGTAIISRSRQFERWNAAAAVVGSDGVQLSDQELAAKVRAKVPWRIVGSRLVRSVTMWQATILENGKPLVDEKLELVFRKPADLSSSSTWNATAYQNKTYSITTDDTGKVARDGLQPGTYSIVRGAQTYLLEIDADDGERAVELTQLGH